MNQPCIYSHTVCLLLSSPLFFPSLLLSNLRARNYKIEEADRMKSKQIAGKIIPAIATTTALVAGLICFEYYKIVHDKPLEQFRNGFINLALPFFGLSEPIGVEANTVAMPGGDEWEWSLWDAIEINQPDMTLKELIDHIQTRFAADISMLSHGVSILHSFFAPKAKAAKRMGMTMFDLVEEVTKKKIDDTTTFLIFEVCCTDADDEDIDLPYIRFRCR